MSIAVTAVLLGGLLLGQTMETGAFEVVSVPAQFRDGVVDTAQGVLYVVAYDRNEVWQVDPATGDLRNKAPVDNGPSHLALSRDGALLACVNRLSKTVTLVRVPGMEVLTSVPCGDGPRGIAALPGGGFAVANSFSDSVTLIDPSTPQQPTVIEGLSAVPNGVAASESFLAVTTCVPPALLLMKGGADPPGTSISLPDVPQAVSVLSRDRFVVATRSALVLVDATRARVEAQRKMAVQDVVVDGGRVYGLTESAVEILGAKLELIKKLKLMVPGVALAVSGDAVLVLSPAQVAFQVAGIGPRVVAEAVPEVEPAQLQPETAAEPVEQPTTPEAVETVTAEVPMPAETEPAVPPDRPESQEWTYRGPTGRMSLMRAATYAPRPGRRPSPSPLDRPSRKTVMESLLTVPGFGSRPGGFEPIDWSEPLENLRADIIQIPEGQKGIIEAIGNVSLTLGDTSFSAGEVYINREAREMQARDQVELRQPTASLQADEVWYRFAEVQPEPVIDVTDQEKPSVPLGAFEADNAHLVEPDREITADHIIYDPVHQTAEAENARGQTGVFYFGASKLHVPGPGSAEGEDFWITTCDKDPPHYRVRLKEGSLQEGDLVVGRGARLKLFEFNTPLYWPRWTHRRYRDPRLSFDFDIGHGAEIGYYLNVGQHYAVTPNVGLGVLLYPTEEEGVGLGFAGNYDFMDKPASPLFRSKGNFRVLGTTTDRGLGEMYHRHEITENAVVLGQVEQWFDEDSLKDFYYSEFRDRTEPRTFANLTYTRPSYIATGTVRKRTNGFVRETERLPEATFHLLERKIADNLYLTFDAVGGYNEREPLGMDATRFAHIGRLTYDWNLGDALNIAPFVELEGTWYSHELGGEGSAFRFTPTAGATLQTRLQKAYPGRFGFDAFKHIVIPSFTYSYRPDPTTGVDETPRFDALDNVFGRSRLESKVDHVVFGRDEQTGETWQVGRLTLYQGTDFTNEISKAQDFEVELDLRPRPWWGFQVIGERHEAGSDLTLDSPFAFERFFLDLYERITGVPYDAELAYQFEARDGDFSRVLTYCYYDNEALDGNLNGRIGFAYTETESRVFNREILYGLGYEVTDKWSLAFEHRYDFEEGELTRQQYELRRRLHCWEAALQFRDRRKGFDVRLEFNLTAFPGTGVKF